MLTAMWLQICQEANTIYTLKRAQERAAIVAHVNPEEYPQREDEIRIREVRHARLHKDWRTVSRLTSGKTTKR